MPKWFTYLKNGMTSKMPEDRINGVKGYGDFNNNIKIIIPFTKGHLHLFSWGAVMLFVAFLVNIPQPLVMRFLIDKVIINQQLELLGWTVAVLVGLLAGTKIAGTIEEYCFTRFQQIVTLKIQSSLLKRTLHFPKSFFDKNETGYLVSRLIHDIKGLEWFFSGNIINLFNQILRFIGGIIFLFYLEWRIALPVLISIPITWFSAWFFSKKMYIINHRQREQNAQLTKHLQETIATTSLIKSFATEERTAKKVKNEFKKLLNINLEQFFVNMMANTGNNLAFSAVKIFVLGFGAYWVITGNWTLGSLLAFQGYLGFVFGPAMFLISSNQVFQQARTSLDRVAAMFKILPEENIGSGIKIKKISQPISFENVTFAYKNETILEDLNFKVESGEHIAIIGESGVGKTTLINLLMRFYLPQKGKIVIGDYPVGDYELLTYRKRFGYVAQGNILKNGTIWDNLTYGNLKATRKEVELAAKNAQIHKFINTLPEKYNTNTGERGVILSEGQRQRLCIARALVNDPDILILDEPTSALDNSTESSILSKLKHIAKDKTLFIIAHQLSCVKQVDRLVFLKNKKIIADGSHQKLIKESIDYRNFFKNSEQ